MSTPLIDSPIVESVKPLSTVVTRVDSDRTDESSFGSQLTTPVDENVDLFSSIGQRIFNKNIGLPTHGAVEYLGRQCAEQKFLEVMGQEHAKLLNSSAYSVPLTPSPSLDAIEAPTPLHNQLIPQVTRARSASLYSLPNLPLPISGETPEAQSEDEPYPSSDHDVSSLSGHGTDSSFGDRSAPTAEEKLLHEDLTRTAQELFSLLPFADNSTCMVENTILNDLDSSHSQLSLSSALPVLLRVLLFLPWCVLAGAAILMLPRHLELLVFQSGYATPSTGIRRLAFWADIAPQLVQIFVAAVIVLWCVSPTLSLCVVGGVATQTAFTWLPYKADQSVPLGEDDKQALYLVWKQYKHGDGFLHMKETERGFLMTDTDENDTNDDKDL